VVAVAAEAAAEQATTVAKALQGEVRGKVNLGGGASGESEGSDDLHLR
jgi:hypothetical protein